MKKYSIFILVFVMTFSLGMVVGEILPSKEFLYKHGYEFVGKPTKEDKRIPILKVRSGSRIDCGTSFYIKGYLMTAEHVSRGRDGFSKVSGYDAAYRKESSDSYFNVNNNSSEYRGDCTIYGYIDGVLREYKGKIIGVSNSGDTPYSVRSNLVAKMRIRSGVSGGAVVDSNGNILGIAHSTYKDDDGTYHTIISPIDKVLEEM